MHKKKSSGRKTDSGKNSVVPLSHKADSMNLTIHQNPVHGQYTVSFSSIDSSANNEIAEGNVYNMLGQNLYYGKLNIALGNELFINLSSQPKGVYLIIARTKDKLWRRKVVIM